MKLKWVTWVSPNQELCPYEKIRDTAKHTQLVELSSSADAAGMRPSASKGERPQKKLNL